ncbi:MAG: hypothetical protein ACLVEJ_10810 [Parabacteroides sp.]
MSGWNQLKTKNRALYDNTFVSTDGIAIDASSYLLRRGCIRKRTVHQCELTGNMMCGKSDFETASWQGDWSIVFNHSTIAKGIIVGMLPS